MDTLQIKPKKTSSKKSLYSAGSLTTSGTTDERDIWLINLAAQFDRACDYFWTKTPERRKVQAEFKKNCSYINNRYASK
jgi:hypothetical protein